MINKPILKTLKRMHFFNMIIVTKETKNEKSYALL